MSKLKNIKSVIVVFITLPIWLYLLYSILVQIEATDLQFILFWVYVPFSILVGVINKYMD